MNKLFLLVVVGIFLIGNLSAFEFDNSLSYSEDKMTATIINACIPLTEFCFGDKIGEATLTSHSSPTEVKHVIEGKDRAVMWYDFNFTNEYPDGLGTVEFTNLDNGKIVNKDYYFAEATYRDVSVYDYEEVCKANENNTKLQVCSNQVSGSHLEKQFDKWIKLDTTNIPSGIKRVALITDVNKGDLIDGVWTIAGKEIREHAVWDASWDTGLVAYYNMTGKLEDVFGGDRNLTLGTASALQFINNATTESNSSFFIDDTNTAIANVSRQEFFGLNGTANQNFTITGWIKFNNQNPTRGYILSKGAGNGWTFSYATSAIDGFDLAGLTNGSFVTGNISVNKTIYNFFAITRNDTAVKFWFNSTVIKSQMITANPLTTGNENLLQFGGNSDSFGATNTHDGYIDEVGFWNRTLSDSEISGLYNSGARITRSVQTADSSPTVTLNSPLNNTNFSKSEIFLNATATDDFIIHNVTIWFNGTTTNTTTNDVTNASNVTLQLNLSDGTYNWTAFAYDNSSQRTNASTFFFTIDSTAPLINVTTPRDSILYHRLDNNLSLNWSVADTNLQACWFNYNLINTTVTCGDNNYSFAPVLDYQNITFYANDTYGNVGSNLTTWNYGILEINQSFRNRTIESSLEYFNISVRTNGSSITIATLMYNITNGSGSINSQGSNNYFITASVTVPNVDALNNVSFYWDLTTSTSLRVNTTTRNQTVVALSLSNCTTNSILFLNYTLIDEETQNIINGSFFNSTIEVELNLYPSLTGNAILNFSANFSNFGFSNNTRFCLANDLGSSTFYLDVLTRYDGDLYAGEIHNIQKATTTNSSLPIRTTLFDLLDADTTEFLITFKDTNLLPVEDALINVQRKYIPEALFKNVEIPKTDVSGQTEAHLDRDSIIYTFLVVKNGVILGTFNNVVIQCQDIVIGRCEINLNALSSITPIQNFNQYGEITASTSFDKNTRTITAIFTTTDGSAKTVLLNATKYDAFGNSSVCFQSLTATSGTLTCAVPSSYGNLTIVSKLFVNGKLAVQEIFTQSADPFQSIGQSNVGVFVLYNEVSFKVFFG